MKKMHCFGCDIEKDLDVLEVSPTADADGLTDNPITPLLVIDCQGPLIPNDPNGYSEFRVVVVCHECFHKLEPDMWIGKSCWDRISPHIPYDKLPLWDHNLLEEVSIHKDPSLLKPLP